MTRPVYFCYYNVDSDGMCLSFHFTSELYIFFRKGYIDLKLSFITIYSKEIIAFFFATLFSLFNLFSV